MVKQVFRKMLAPLLALMAFTQEGTAALILTDLPSDAYITVDGLDWAWASPVASAVWGGNILYTPDLHAGWRYATAAEWANRPNASAFLVLPNTAAAVPYWNSQFTHIDYTDGLSGHVTSLPDGSYGETWYVRTASVPDGGSTMMLLGIAMSGVAWVRRKTLH